MLLGNRSVILRTPGRHFAGATISDNRSNWNIPSSSRTLGMTDQASGVIGGECAGIPNGYAPPYCWVIPRKSGGLATANQLGGSHALTLSSLAQGVAISTNRGGVITMTSAGGVTAQTIQRILWLATVVNPLTFVSPGGTAGPVETPSWIATLANPLTLVSPGGVAGPVLMPSWMAAALDNPNDLDNNVLNLLTWLSATLEGGNTFDPVWSVLASLGATLVSSNTVTGAVQMPSWFFATLQAEGVLTATSQLLLWCAATLVHDNHLHSDDLHCFAWMQSTITSQGAALTAQTVATAVWAALAAANDQTGSMGAKLNDAASAGDPWGADPSGYPAGTAGYVLQAIGIDATLIRKIEEGRWKIVNNQMVIYDDNGTTPLRTFDLFDANGDPSSTSVFERVPV